MLALYREGRQADALVLLGGRRVLVDELGVDPSAGLVSLHERLLEHDPSLDLRGEPLSGYRLLEKIGETPDGMTSARPSRGSSATSKSRSSTSRSRARCFRQRFEPDAQAVAAIEHTHRPDLRLLARARTGLRGARFLHGPSLRSLVDRDDRCSKESSAPDRRADAVRARLRAWTRGRPRRCR